MDDAEAHEMMRAVAASCGNWRGGSTNLPYRLASDHYLGSRVKIEAELWPQGSCPMQDTTLLILASDLRARARGMLTRARDLPKCGLPRDDAKDRCKL
jgi:hypothetical protein